MSALASFLKLSVFISLIVSLQLNVLPVLSFIPVKPDLLLALAVIYSSRSASLSKALAWGASLGLLKDAFSVRFFGFNSFAFAADAFIISFTCRRFYKESLWFDLMLIVSAGIVNCFLISLVSGRPYFVIGPAEAVMNCLFFPLLGRVYNFTIDYRLSAID